MFSPIRKKVDILRHEAGHIVLAKLLGFRTGSVRLRSRDAGAEIIIDQDLTDLDSIRSFIRRRVVVLYAGVCAEALRANRIDGDKVTNDLESELGMNDFAKIRELLRVLAGIEGDGTNNQELLNVYPNKYLNVAAALVEKYATQIEKLSKELSEFVNGDDVTVPGDKVDALPTAKSILFGSEYV